MPPSEYRSRNVPIINPFEQLDATSFDHFVADVTGAIRNALNPTVPPARPSRVRAFAAIVASAGAKGMSPGDGSYGNTIPLDSLSNGISSPAAPSTVDDTEATQGGVHSGFHSHYSKSPSALRVLRSRGVAYHKSPTQLQPQLVNGHRDGDISHAVSTSGSTRRRSPSIVDLISDSEEASEKPSPTPVRTVYPGNAAAEVDSEGEVMSDDDVVKGHEDFQLDERQEVELVESDDEAREEQEQEQEGYDDDDDDDGDADDEVDDTFLRQVSRGRRILNDDYEDEEEYLAGDSPFFEDDEEEEIESLPDDSAYVEGVYSFPIIRGSKGKGRALDEGPGVKALHGISRRMEEHPELYMPSYSVPSHSDDSDVSYEQDGSEVAEQEVEKGNNGEEEEADELDEERRGYISYESDEEPQEQVYSEGEDYPDRSASSPTWQVFDDDGAGEDEEDGESEAEISSHEQVPGGSGHVASDPIIVDDDDEDHEVEDGPTPMLVDAPPAFQGDEEVGPSLSLTPPAVAETFLDGDQLGFSAESTPLFGDYTDSQSVSGSGAAQNGDDLGESFPKCSSWCYRYLFVVYARYATDGDGEIDLESGEVTPNAGESRGLPICCQLGQFLISGVYSFHRVCRRLSTGD